jgi:hypothetical protein
MRTTRRSTLIACAAALLLGFDSRPGHGRETVPQQAPIEASIELKNPAGLRLQLEQRGGHWTLGTLFIHGKLVDAPLTSGLLALRSTSGGRVIWPAATDGKQTDGRTARFFGSEKIGEVTFRFEVEVALKADLPVATLAPRWSVDMDLSGYEVCLAYHGIGNGGHDAARAPGTNAGAKREITSGWRCTVYPFAGNATRVQRDRLTYVGVPAVLMFREDMSLVTLFGIDPAFDYLNPNRWTGATGFHFDSGKTPPQYRIGGGKLLAGVDYSMPLQIIVSDAGNSPDAITQLARTWIKANDYKVQPLKVRSHQDAFDLFLAGRRKSKMWRPGLGYQIMENWRVIYTAESPINAYFDYLLYEQTSEPMWRQRAFETMALVLRAQHTDSRDPHFGVIETNYELDADPKVWTIKEPPFTGEKVDAELKSGRFNSRDHSPNFGYKLDMNGYAARYMLMLWKRVKEKEGVDQRKWREAAVRIADWIVRQQHPDGGLPQVVDYRLGRVASPPASMSVVSGRTLAAMPTIAEITRDKRYAKLAGDLELFLREKVEARYWFTGAHVDLWPNDYEADSVWHAVEYWLDKFDRTNNRECLKRAEADVWFAFLMWCPKQLPWVKNPTQTCHAEQENYLQYSNYCYNNRKYCCLDRLAKLTGDPLFGQMCERIIQCGFWGQAVSGDWLGGQYERMSDSWMGVSRDVNSLGQVYVSELALDAHLQLLEMGLVRAGKK